MTERKTPTRLESELRMEEDDNECTFWGTILALLNTINHGLVLLVTGYLVYLSRDLSNTTNLHVMLCTIGYVLLMSEAIVVLAGENIWTRRLTRRSNGHLHWVLQVLGASFSVAGVYVMYAKRSSHFRSVHSIAGIASLATIIAMFVSGLPVLFAAKLRKTVRPVVRKFIHNFLGIGCFAVGMTAQCLGYKKGWLRSRASNEIVTVMIVTTAMITVFSLIDSLRSLVGQFKSLVKWR